MKCLILFGSISDGAVAENIVRSLKGVVDCELAYISAHRDPEKLMAKLSEDTSDFIIAGAGLAAHLPGVVASKVTKPVLGMPVASQFKGLDAFASIVQMPGGVPVLSFLPEDVESLANFIKNAKKIVEKKIYIQLPEDKADWIVKKIDFLREFSNDIEVTTAFKTGALNLVWGDIPIIDPEILAIRIPFMSKIQTQEAISFLQFFEDQKSGAFVGVNNLANGILMSKKIMNTFFRSSI